MTQPRSLDRALALALPFAYALLLPLLPLLIELADVLPRGVAVVGKPFAQGLALIVAAAAAASAIGCARTYGLGRLVRTPLAWVFAALIGTEAIAAATGIAWRAGLFEVVCEVGNALCFAVLWLTLADERVRRAFLGTFFVSGIGACAFAIALTLSRHPPAQFAYEHGRAAGTFLQPNEFAGYLLFLVPLGLAQSASPRLLARLGWAAASLGAIALAMSASRAAVLGMLLALPMLVNRFGRRALVAYCIAAVAALALGSTLLRNVAHDPSENASRIAVWQGAARMAERFALTGVGPLAFSVAYPVYKMPDAQIDEVHAHSLPLNILVENGLLGLLALTFAVVRTAGAAREAGRRIAPSDRERGFLYAAIATGLAASALQNAVDLVSTFVFLMWWPMMGLLLGMTRGDDDRARA